MIDVVGSFARSANHERNEMLFDYNEAPLSGGWVSVAEREQLTHWDDVAVIVEGILSTLIVCVFKFVVMVPGGHSAEWN